MALQLLSLDKKHWAKNLKTVNLSGKTVQADEKTCITADTVKPVEVPHYKGLLQNGPISA